MKSRTRPQPSFTDFHEPLFTSSFLRIGFAFLPLLGAVYLSFLSSPLPPFNPLGPEQWLPRVMDATGSDSFLIGHAPTLAVAAAVEDDIALKLRDARKRLKDLQQTREELRGKVAALRADNNMALANEDALYSRLAQLRYAANERVFYISRFTENLELLQTARAMMEQRKEEDELTIRNVDIEVEKLRNDCNHVTNMLQVQRAETLRQINEMSRRFVAEEKEAKQQRAELRRLEQETQEIADRTDNACLKHARELFGVAPGY